MTLKVIDFNKKKTKPLGVERLLDEVKGEGLDTVIVIGYALDKLYFASTNISVDEMVFVLEKIKFNLLAGAYEEEE